MGYTLKDSNFKKAETISRFCFLLYKVLGYKDWKMRRSFSVLVKEYDKVVFILF
jgi:hypothetical protein